MFPLFWLLAYPLTVQPEFSNLFLQVPVPSLFQVKRGRQKLSPININLNVDEIYLAEFSKREFRPFEKK